MLPDDFITFFLLGMCAGLAVFPLVILVVDYFDTSDRRTSLRITQDRLNKIKAERDALEESLRITSAKLERVAQERDYLNQVMNER